MQSEFIDDDSENKEMSEDLCLLPWESRDPSVRKYYDDNAENRMLDQIIAREFEQIEQNMH